MVKTKLIHGPKARRPGARHPEAARPHHRPTDNVARNPRPAGRSGLPSRDEILEFIKSAAQDKRQTKSLGKKEIARAFSVKAGERIALKRLLAEMTEDGLLEGNRKGF